VRFPLDVLRLWLCACFATLLPASDALATIVFHRTGTNRIVAARDDGSHARTVARGCYALLAPRGGLVAVAGKAGSSGFPDGGQVAIGVSDEVDSTELRVYRGGHSRRMTRGTEPLWGRGGIAFLGPNGALRLKPKPGAKSRPLAQPTLGPLHPIGWSKNGGR